MIWNLSKKNIMSRSPVTARGLYGRARGMIGRDFIGFDAMIFYNCNMIHTMFMSVDIDVIFLDRENRICEIRGTVPPWTPFIRSSGAAVVIEVPAGTARKTGAAAEDILDLNAELSNPDKIFSREIEPVTSPETAIPYKNGKI